VNAPESPLPVAQYLARQNTPAARVVPLTGDASDRRYFRVLAGEMRPYVLAVHAAPFDAATLPFVNVAELFAAMPVPVPRILGLAPDLGVLALEDLGDVTLQAHVGVAPAPVHAALYREAVDLIDVIQRRGRDLADSKYVPYAMAFDVEKLTWEFDFFIKHYLEGYRGVAFGPGAREALRQELSAIAEELAAEPRVLCHRDYHSRNLMLHDGRLSVIDFQDARMGPDTYDLASLLRDSYVDLPDDVAHGFVSYFLSVQGRMHDAPAFQQRFDLASLQRNLKALGTFGYQTTARRNTVYIQYMPRTLGYARENLHKYGRFGRLAELLAAHVAELR
jgi:aminoglycoside/choline kinase family phosphotransferase